MTPPITEGGHSEVARLRAQIEREHQCAEWARAGLAIGTAKHRFITRRMDRIGEHQAELASLVGEAVSMAIVCQILESDGTPSRTGGTS